MCIFFPFSLCSDALSIRNNISLRKLSYMHSKTSMWLTTSSVFSAEIKIMALTNLSVRTKLSRPCERPRDVPEAVGGATRVHFRVPLRLSQEGVLRYRLTLSLTNYQLFLALAPAVATAYTQQPTTASNFLSRKGPLLPPTWRSLRASHLLRYLHHYTFSLSM